MQFEKALSRFARVFVACLIGASALLAAILALYGTDDFEGKLIISVIVFSCIAVFITISDVIYQVKNRSSR